MNDDRGHVAMPRLYGAPAYARPPLQPVSPVERPLDPDDLPLESERDGDAQRLSDRPPGNGQGVAAASTRLSAQDAGKPAKILGRALRRRLPGRDQAGR